MNFEGPGAQGTMYGRADCTEQYSSGRTWPSWHTTDTEPWGFRHHTGVTLRTVLGGSSQEAIPLPPPLAGQDTLHFLSLFLGYHTLL